MISWTEKVQNRMWVRQRSYGVLWYMSWDRGVWDYSPFNYHSMAGNLNIEHAIRILCYVFFLPNASSWLCKSVFRTCSSIVNIAYCTHVQRILLFCMSTISYHFVFPKKTPSSGIVQSQTGGKYVKFLQDFFVAGGCVDRVRKPWLPASSSTVIHPVMVQLMLLRLLQVRSSTPFWLCGSFSWLSWALPMGSL